MVQNKAGKRKATPNGVTAKILQKPGIEYCSGDIPICIDNDKDAPERLPLSSDEMPLEVGLPKKDKRA